MIKKLDILLLKSFVGPFIVTFFVSLFVLVMQFFWLYMDELIGKGLGIWAILELLMYMSSTMVPLALPLGILLASIMTFGNMGENYELVAIKSAGISLNRFMRPLVIFIIFVSFGAFIFNNNVIPVANLKALSLLYDLRNSKPTLNIRAGQFNNDIPDFAIRVGEKDKDGRTIRNVIIYDQTSHLGNDNVLLAERGEMIPSKDKKFLIFRLKDGWRYQEGVNASLVSGPRHDEQTRMHFRQYDKVFDLSGFKINRTNEDLFKSSHQMMNVRQLTTNIRNMSRDRDRDIARAEIYINPYLTIQSNTGEGKAVRKAFPKGQPIAYKKAFLERVPDSLKAQVVEIATGNIRNQTSMLAITAAGIRLQADNLRKYEVEVHKKFTLSFACVLLFLIGAPLGAIIRKGGLGMPMVVAVGFFVIYYIISLTGEKLGTTGALPPFAGMWLATAMLLPIAFIMIRAARTDSQLFSKEWYARMGRRLTGLFKKAKTDPH